MRLRRQAGGRLTNQQIGGKMEDKQERDDQEEEEEKFIWQINVVALRITIHTW